MCCNMHAYFDSPKISVSEFKRLKMQARLRTKIFTGDVRIPMCQSVETHSPNLKAVFTWINLL